MASFTTINILARHDITTHHWLRDPTKRIDSNTQRSGFVNKTAVRCKITTRGKCFAQWWDVGIFRKKIVQNPLSKQADELRDLLITDVATDWDDRVQSLIGQLCEAEGKYEESYMDGKWQVVHTAGPLLWERLTSPFRDASKPNRSFQDFEIQEGKVTNMAELSGEKVFVTASGSFAQADDTKQLPKRINAFIEQGSVVFGERSFQLPIKGKGYFDVMYLDRNMRIFRGENGSMTVQIPAGIA